MENNSGTSWEKTVEWAFVKNFLKSTEFAAPLDGTQEVSDAFFSQDSHWFLIEFKHTYDDLISEEEKYPSLSRKRTKSILRKLGASKAELDQLPNGPLIKWWTQSLALEEKIELKNNPPSRGGPALNNLSSRLKQAKEQFESLNSTYGLSPSLPPEKTEPHFFIYSKDNDFKNLKMLPYWGTWDKNFKRPVTEDNVSTMWAYGKNFPDFSKYVKLVAIARGYSTDWIGEGGDGAVFQQVVGLVEGKDRGMVMSLGDFLVHNDKILTLAMKKKNQTTFP